MTIHMHIVFKVDIENGWMRLNNTITKKIRGKLSNDYRFSYLWIGLW